MSLVLLCSADCRAADYSGAYYCTPVGSGGLQFNKTLSEWQATTFNKKPGDDFIIRARKTGQRVATDPTTNTQTELDDYKLTYADSGAKDAENCGPQPDGSFSMWGWANTVECYASLEDVRVNLDKLRYLKTYLVGFIDGEDNDENTPFLEGGTCTKIPN